MATDVQVRRGSLVITPGRVLSKISLLDWLQQELWLPRSFVATLFAQGRVRVAGTRVTADAEVPSGKKLWLVGPEASETKAEASETSLRPLPTPTILYEDDHVLVLDKPAGLLVHSDGTGVSDTLVARLRQYLDSGEDEAQVTHIHRLDRDTTGCVLFAKHAFAARALDFVMVERQIHRTYLAVVCGAFTAKQGRLDAPIGRDRHKNAYRVSPTGKSAVTLFHQLDSTEPFVSKQDSLPSGDPLSIVSCTLETGRTHQIRVHFSSVGCPIVGDELYGGARTGQTWDWLGPGQALHAWRLQFPHPYTKEIIRVEAPLPEYFTAFCDSVGLTTPSSAR